MSITTNSIETSPIHQGTITSRWKVNASSADVSGCETVVSAPGSGSELVVSYLLLTIGGAITITIGMGEESSAVKRTLLGPLGGAAMTLEFDWDDEGIVLDPNAALTVDGSGAGVVCIYAEGITRTVDVAGIASASPSASVSASPSASVSSSPS